MKPRKKTEKTNNCFEFHIFDRIDTTGLNGVEKLQTKFLLFFDIEKKVKFINVMIIFFVNGKTNKKMGRVRDLQWARLK